MKKSFKKKEIAIRKFRIIKLIKYRNFTGQNVEKLNVKEYLTKDTGDNSLNIRESLSKIRYLIGAYKHRYETFTYKIMATFHISMRK